MKINRLRVHIGVNQHVVLDPSPAVGLVWAINQPAMLSINGSNHVVYRLEKHENGELEIWCEGTSP